MRKKRSPSLRGSVTQNTMSVRMRAEEPSGLTFATRLGLLAGGVLLCACLVFWFWRSGHMREEAENLRDAFYRLTRQAQFTVKDVEVEGRHRAAKEDIFDALGTQRGAALFAFDAAAAAARLVKLPWVESATVERRLPDTISVSLTEREPSARWQHDDKFYVIDDQGQVLPAAQAEEFPTLPLFVGTGANEAARDLLALLKPYPAIEEKMDSAVRVGERRWDLHMQPHMTVRLPEDDAAGALRRLSVLIAQDRILDREIVAIDLRLPDRLTLEPAPPANPPAPNHPGSAPK